MRESELCRIEQESLCPLFGCQGGGGLHRRRKDQNGLPMEKEKVCAMGRQSLNSIRTEVQHYNIKGRDRIIILGQRSTTKE